MSFIAPFVAPLHHLQQVLARHKEGKAFYYEAVTPRIGTFTRMTRRIAEIFCGGSPAQLIAQLIQSEKLSAEDIAVLQHITAQKAEQSSKKKNRGGNKA